MQPDEPTLEYTGKPDSVMSQITRDQYADWEANYRPTEDAYLDWLMDEGRIQGDVTRAGELAGEQVTQAEGITDRNMARYGLQLTPEQQKAQARLRKLSATSVVADARNRARGMIADQQLEGLGFMTRAMREQAGQATGMIGTAAGMQTSRDAANRAASAQHQAGMFNTAVTIGTTMMLLCSGQYKEAVRSFDADRAIDLLKRCDVQSFRYMGNAPVDETLKGREMIGLIAEDTPHELRAGEGVDLANMVGALMAATRALIYRIEELEGRL